ncbi:MAG: DUF4157 domain-containing protein [Burkholderiales bacterium]|nr:DUF4157 domain-containing protein [Burkholderiales bacterium]
MAEMMFQKKQQQHELVQRKRGVVLADNRGTGLSSEVGTGTATLADNRGSVAQRNNTGLPDQLKSGVEALSGMSMDQVRVHYNSPKPAQLQAHAYAQGTDIHLAAGQEKHLPHEAWHVVQQAQGRVRPTMQLKAGTAINDDTGLEREADVMGEQALQMHTSATAAHDTQQETPIASPVVQRAFDEFGNEIPDFPQADTHSHDSTSSGMLEETQTQQMPQFQFGGGGMFSQQPNPFTFPSQHSGFSFNPFAVSSTRSQESSTKKTRRDPKFVDWGAIKNKRQEYSMQIRKEKRDEQIRQSRFKHVFEAQREGEEREKWAQEIHSKNPAVLESGIYKDEWYLMPYADILAEESEAVMATLQSWFPTTPTDTEGLAQIYNEPNLQKVHPLVTSFEPHLEDNGTLALQFSINPTYVKYLDTSGKKLALRIGGGTNAISGLASHATDVLFQPQTITVNGTSTEVGKVMHARRLSQDHPLGMTAAKDSKQETLMHDLAKSGGSANTMYIKGHLLNDHLGGPARTENLFPITQEANGQHVYWVEKYVKAEIAKGYVMEYSVEVPSYTISASQIVGSTRNGYTIDSSFKCHSARMDVGGNPIDSYDITIVSRWGAAEKPLHNHTTPVDDPATLPELTNKLASGTPNKGKTNADVKDVDTATYAQYLKPGYSQGSMASGTHSDVTLQDHTGALPFSLSGSKSKISAATQADLESVVGKHKANLIYAAISKLGAKSDKTALLAIAGIGPKTVEALEKEFDLS